MTGTVAVDTGGTFTDVVWVADGRAGCRKVPSERDEPHLAVLRGAAGLDPRRLLVGTTVVTNALLERKLPPAAFLTTSGFEDVLEIGRQVRLELYDLSARKAPCPVPRRMRFGLAERVDSRGRVLRPLDETAVARLAEELRGRGVDRAAVGFIFSILNPRHEDRAAEILTAAGLRVRCSHRILPLPREYERFLTTYLSVYAEPVLERFLGGVEAGTDAEVAVISSWGGYVRVEEAVSRAVQTVLSGPAGGAAAAAALARRLGLGPVVSLDMGGTSCDVCAVAGGVPLERGIRVGEWELPLRAVAVRTVGAGGGSIVWTDEGGGLRTGPRSAGADPGPAAYGRGGPPTVTDADLLLGRLPASLPSGLRLDADAAAAALGEVARGLGATTKTTAEGVVAVAEGAMAEAVRAVTVRRGLDVRRFALLAFGGAGPAHAAGIAARLGVRRVVVPPEPGVFSAWGLLTAPAVMEEAEAVMRRLDGMDDAEWTALRDRLAARLSGARARLHAELRYLGQEHEMSVAVPVRGGDVAGRLRRRFAAAHKREYGHAPDGPVEVVTVVARSAAGGTAAPEIEFEPLDAAPAGALTRTHVAAAGRVRGPVMICDYSATTWVPAGWTARVTDGVLFLERR